MTRRPGAVGRDLQNGAVRVAAEPARGGEGLARLDRQAGQGIGRHQHGGAGVARSEPRQDERRVIVDDLGSGNHVGAGHGGRVPLDDIALAVADSRRGDGPGGIGLDAVGDEVGDGHAIEHALPDLPAVLVDGLRHRRVRNKGHPGRDRIERLVERRGVAELEDVVDVRLLDLVPRRFEIEVEGIARPDPKGFSLR